MAQGKNGASGRKKKPRKGVNIYVLIILAILAAGAAYGAGFAVQAGFNFLVDMLLGDGDVSGIGRPVPSTAPSERPNFNN